MIKKCGFSLNSERGSTKAEHPGATVVSALTPCVALDPVGQMILGLPSLGLVVIERYRVKKQKQRPDAAATVAVFSASGTAQNPRCSLPDTEQNAIVCL